MRSMRILATALGFVLMAAVVYAQQTDWLKGATDDKVTTLAGIQPGLGTVMIEYSTRYTTMYYAAKGGNWDLAAYQLKEALEIQEVGETTRPARAPALKAFEKSYLVPLDAAIKAKNFSKFDHAFRAGIQGCNACHVGQGFAYIKYVLPRAPLSPLSMTK